LVVINYVASILSLSPDTSKDYDWQSRTSQVHNAEIREYYGFEKFNRSFAGLIERFIKTDLFPQGLSLWQVIDEVYKLLKKFKIEPQTHNEFASRIHDIYKQCETKFFTFVTFYP